MKNILVATPEATTCEIIRNSFKSVFEVDCLCSKDLILETFQKKKYEFLFIDLKFLQTEKNKSDYRIQLQPFWQIFMDTEIIVLSPQQLIREAVNAVKAGATDYLTYPINPAELKFIVEKSHENLRIQSELDYLRDQFWKRDSLVMLRTNTPAMREVFDKVRAVAPTESTVLLRGETGTGKGVIAKLIHQHSSRGGNQFINVHCGAIAETLLESELFGHEKGAFTGAIRRKLGKFEIANGGTIFLDEIGTITSAAQIKLLNILQEKIFQRVGGEVDIKTDVRIITATNADLEKMCKDETFRSDLYYRLNVFPVEIPPLRYRINDIPLFVELFLKRLNKYSNKKILHVHPEVLQAFEAYDWPGNIRELDNLVERAYILESSSMLTPRNFPVALFKEKSPKYLYNIDTSRTLDYIRKREIERIEKQYLSELLLKNHGKINVTAEAAGLGVRQLHKLLTKYNLHKEDYKIINK